MSTFNQPPLEPGRVEREEEVPQEPGKRERPSPEKVSPTQQGKFLGELEKKEKKKEIKPVSGETEEEGAEDTSSGIFGLAGKPKEKARKGVSEEGGKEGQQGGQGQPLPTAPILPQMVSEEAEEHVAAPEQVQAHAEAEQIAQSGVPVLPVKEEGGEIQPEENLPGPEEEHISETPVQRGPVEKEVPGTPVQRGPVEKEVPGTPVRRGPVEKEVPGTPVRRGPVEKEVPGTPVRRGPVEKQVPATPVQRGPVEKEVPGTPVRRGPVPEQAARPFEEVSEEKERVAFQPTPAKKEEIPVAQQPIQISAQPEITIKPKEPTVEDARVAREAMIELFKQTVDAVATVVTAATTTTMVTVRHPPIFEGASILVTEYSSAKKEYNITFVNLSPDARRLIEAAGSENQLRQALIDKGYTLHMMTIETRPFTITQAGVETSTPEGERKGRSTKEGGRGGEKKEGGPLG